jgi:hypothetical protein
MNIDERRGPAKAGPRSFLDANGLFGQRPSSPDLMRMEMGGGLAGAERNAARFSSVALPAPADSSVLHPRLDGFFGHAVRPSESRCLEPRAGDYQQRHGGGLLSEVEDLIDAEESRSQSLMSRGTGLAGLVGLIVSVVGLVAGRMSSNALDAAPVGHPPVGDLRPPAGTIAGRKSRPEFRR